MLRLLLVGYGGRSYIEALRTRSHQLGIAERIIWHGPVVHEMLPALLAAADLACYPGEHSISLLEAMACGLPVVAVDAPKVAEDLAYDNGLLVPPGDAAALARALARLLSEPGLRAAMGGAGRRAAVDHHSWEAVNARFLELYARRRRERRP